MVYTESFANLPFNFETRLAELQQCLPGGDGLVEPRDIKRNDVKLDEEPRSSNMNAVC